MNIYWFSGRSLKDLCSTTQVALATGLVNRGHKLTFVNPDPEGSHTNRPWNHQSIPSRAPLGLQSKSLGRNMKRWFTTEVVDCPSVALVDWRIANALVPLFRQRNIPWVLIDRSPPADRGLLPLFQWPSWKRSWKLVKKGDSSCGCVVSEAHRNFVINKTGARSESIVTLPAGVDLELFQTGNRFETFTLIYHGRLDRHRGIMALPMLLRKSQALGIEAKLVLVGEGDAFSGLQAIAENDASIEVKQSLPQKELAELLSKCHVGLLPMPERKVWAIASPLKRSEYAASGLLIYGVDHAGHQFTTTEELEWMNLVSQEQFHDAGVKWLANIQESDLEALSRKSRMFAEHNLAWERTVEALDAVILSLSQ
ncbi:MAG: glycosyltransferase family 4 protein [Candidatus Poseidoniaceae archaeon]|nr:glycosyltransferase family 4 protein [Candidatus Poseidoniaceae archaeon]